VIIGAGAYWYLNWDWAPKFWHLGVAGLAMVMAVTAAIHAVLNKRESVSALAWVGFIWLVPLGGAVLYFIFGVNRLRRRAASLRSDLDRYQAEAFAEECLTETIHQQLPDRGQHLTQLAHVVRSIVDRPLLPGNTVEPLINGDEAYPAMLEAIRNAKASIAFETYIFDRDESGLAFARAFGEARRRGVSVKVLIDAAGTRYSWPSILPELAKEEVETARFLPTFALWRLMSMNLRTHRKILVVDGQIGFTGGMNIRAGNCLRNEPIAPVQDLHFRLTGPVVRQLQEAFVDDWLFTTGETLRGDRWFPQPALTGDVLARGVSDGPDEDYEKLRWTILAALSLAKRTVRLVTPYFAPDQGVIAALNLAAMRGVEVDILLPAENNLKFVHWASRAMWDQVLEHGCRLWLTQPPFDHSKLLIVDECWVLLGSANWDARSLRLNFEYNVECYNAALASQLEALVEQKRAGAHLVTASELANRPFFVRLLDGTARLLTPYL
jgi:cardiolipin synthase